MTAKNASRITTEGRTFLPDVIPLSTPYLVFLDPSDLCNAKCGFCPTGSGEARKYRKSQLMEWNVYTKAINDLADMPEPIKVLRLYKDGEPLLNDAICEMIQYAADTKRFGQIDLTTNGTLLTQNMGSCLIDAGLDKIFISVPQDYNLAYLYQVSFFFNYSGGRCKVFVKIIGDGLSDAGISVFKSDFRAISDEMAVEYLANCWPDFKVDDVGAKGIYGQSLPENAVDVCPYIFYSTAINSDGTVPTCFLDYRHDMIVGDLRKQSFKDIWNGDAMSGMRLAHLMGYRCEIKHCKNCQQLRYGQPDNIDRYADEILKKLTKGAK